MNLKGAGAICLTGREPRLIAVNTFAIFLPLELNLISCGFNTEGYICSSGYWLFFWTLDDLRKTMCEEKVITAALL